MDGWKGSKGRDNVQQSTVICAEAQGSRFSTRTVNIAAVMKLHLKGISIMEHTLCKTSPRPNQNENCSKEIFQLMDNWTSALKRRLNTNRTNLYLTPMWLLDVMHPLMWAKSTLEGFHVLSSSCEGRQPAWPRVIVPQVWELLVPTVLTQSHNNSMRFCWNTLVQQLPRITLSQKDVRRNKDPRLH